MAHHVLQVINRPATTAGAPTDRSTQLISGTAVQSFQQPNATSVLMPDRFTFSGIIVAVDLASRNTQIRAGRVVPRGASKSKRRLKKKATAPSIVDLMAFAPREERH